MRSQYRKDEVTLETIDLPQRKRIYVIMNNKTVWKGLFFKSEAQAEMVLKRFHPKCQFVKDNDGFVEKPHGRRFTIYELAEYTKMDDVKFLNET